MSSLPIPNGAQKGQYIDGQGKLRMVIYDFSPSSAEKAVAVYLMVPPSPPLENVEVVASTAVLPVAAKTAILFAKEKGLFIVRLDGAEGPDGFVQGLWLAASPLATQASFYIPIYADQKSRSSLEKQIRAEGSEGSEGSEGDPYSPENDPLRTDRLSILKNFEALQMEAERLKARTVALFRASYPNFDPEVQIVVGEKESKRKGRMVVPIVTSKEAAEEVARRLRSYISTVAVSHFNQIMDGTFEETAVNRPPLLIRSSKEEGRGDQTLFLNRQGLDRWLSSSSRSVTATREAPGATEPYWAIFPSASPGGTLALIQNVRKGDRELANLVAEAWIKIGRNLGYAPARSASELKAAEAVEEGDEVEVAEVKWQKSLGSADAKAYLLKYSNGHPSGAAFGGQYAAILVPKRYH